MILEKTQMYTYLGISARKEERYRTFTHYYREKEEDTIEQSSRGGKENGNERKRLAEGQRSEKKLYRNKSAIYSTRSIEKFIG